MSTFGMSDLNTSTFRIINYLLGMFFRMDKLRVGSNLPQRSCVGSGSTTGNVNYLLGMFFGMSDE